MGAPLLGLPKSIYYQLYNFSPERLVSIKKCIRGNAVENKNINWST